MLEVASHRLDYRHGTATGKRPRGAPVCRSAVRRGTVQPLAMDGEKALVGPPRPVRGLDPAPACRKLNGQEESRKLVEVGCNLANRRESDIRLPEGIRGRASLASVGLGGWPVWFLLIVLAWVLTCVEWVFYQQALD